MGKTSLEQVKVILKNSCLHIDNEGGYTHIRHAISGGKTAVLFGPTSVDFFGYSDNINIKGEGCETFCEWCTANWQEVCVRGFTYPPCMYSITPEAVFRRISSYLKEVLDE